MTALLGYRFSARALVLPVHQRGGGDLTEHIQYRQESEEHKQEEYVEIASHFALHAFGANWTFLLVIAATYSRLTNLLYHKSRQKVSRRVRMAFAVSAPPTAVTRLIPFIFSDL